MNKLSSGLALLQDAPKAGGSPTGSMISTLVTFGLVFVIFYFLIIRPQSKKQKETQRMIQAVKKGDKVITAGGVHAIVYTVKEKTVILKVDDNTKMEFSKSAIASVVVDSKGEDKLESKADQKAALESETGQVCDICTEPSSGTKFNKVENKTFKRMVQKGFNPFSGNIILPTGLDLSELGTAMGLSKQAQYEQWKVQTMSDSKDWCLCPRCYKEASKYI
jgi:preprotein translocase subunit YajC